MLKNFNPFQERSQSKARRQKSEEEFGVSDPG
jgi:hypothetical protein